MKGDRERERELESKDSKDLPESCCAWSGALPITEVLLDGMGRDGLGRLCIAASACCTASCRTSVGRNKQNNKSKYIPKHKPSSHSIQATLINSRTKWTIRTLLLLHIQIHVSIPRVCTYYKETLVPSPWFSQNQNQINVYLCLSPTSNWATTQCRLSPSQNIKHQNFNGN